MIGKIGQIVKQPIWQEWLVLALLLLSAFLLGQTVSSVVAVACQAPPRLPPAAASAPQEAVEKPVSEIVAGTRLLFSQQAAPSSPEKPGEPQKERPKSALEEALDSAAEGSALKLAGTILGSAASVAFITTDTESFAVHKGEKVGRYKVTTITKNKVILMSPEKRVILKMDFSGQQSGPEVQGAGASGAPAAKAPEPQVIKKVLSKKDFTAILDKPDQMAKDTLFTPVSKDGQPYGIQLAQLGPGSFLKPLDLQPGDVLIDVNGKPLRTAEDAFLAYQMLRNEENVTFTLDRNKKFMKLELQLQ